MTNRKLGSVLLLLAGLFICGGALADRGHGHASVRFYWGVPYAYPYYVSPYYYPYSYYPPAVVVPEDPPVYIERGGAQYAPDQGTATPENYYWYHCNKPEGYYPYIKQCPGGWQKVVPTPPPQ
ncbi:MAG: hypothetical protein P4L87_08790 [Formivibrio sp.]|nr:hypothetical protein [Formivibrio sp.]